MIRLFYGKDREGCNTLQMKFSGRLTLDDLNVFREVVQEGLYFGEVSPSWSTYDGGKYLECHEGSHSSVSEQDQRMHMEHCSGCVDGSLSEEGSTLYFFLDTSGYCHSHLRMSSSENRSTAVLEYRGSSVELHGAARGWKVWLDDPFTLQVEEPLGKRYWGSLCRVLEKIPKGD